MDDYGKLKLKFNECLQENNINIDDGVVEELIKVLKDDYILLVREPLYCSDCVHFHHSMMYNNDPYYCMHYQKSIICLTCADACKHYYNKGQEEKKSIVRLKGQIK